MVIEDGDGRDTKYIVPNTRKTKDIAKNYKDLLISEDDFVAIAKQNFNLVKNNPTEDQISEAQIKYVCRLIFHGTPLTVAMQAAGIGDGKAQKWVKRARDFEAAGFKPESDEIFYIFQQATHQANAAYLVNHIDQLNTNDDWARNGWILERRDRDNWSKAGDFANGSEGMYDPDESFM